MSKATGLTTLSTRPGLTYAMISTFPPTPCGIATFSAALCGGLEAGGARVEVIRASVDGGPTPERVVGPPRAGASDAVTCGEGRHRPR